MRFRSITFILAIISTFCFSLNAQVPPPPPPTIEESSDVIKIDSRLVVVPVAVVDAAGEPVTDLTPKDFRVLEENKRQEIAEVSAAEKVPLEIALLFDISATTNPMFQFQMETAAKFLKEVMRSEDRATIFTVGASPVLVQARDTSERSAIAIKTIQKTKQFTAFFDAVSEAAAYLQKNTPSGRRKVIVAISDGEDTNSARIAKALQDGERGLGKKIDTLDRKSLYQFRVKNRNEAVQREQSRVIKEVQNADAVFYSVNPAGSSYQLNKISQVGQATMQKFADDTGGTAFLPKFLPVDVKNDYENEANMRKNAATLEKIFNQLANELRAQYLVQYYSDADYPNGRYVNIDVGLQNPGNFKVRARGGYFVKN